MYNGIGLETARGSGTNGYVQRNMSFIRRHKDNVDYKSEEELRKIDSQLTKGPNREILDHERKRKVELKCMEMQELMEEQGYSEEEIEHKVSVYRHMLMEKLQSSDDIDAVEKDDLGRPIAKATHQIAEANQARNDQLKAAFGLGEFYKDGSSFDPQRKAKEQAAEALAMAQKKYAMVAADSSSSSSSSSPSPEQQKEHKKSRKDVDNKQKISSSPVAKKPRRHSSSSPKSHKHRTPSSPQSPLLEQQSIATDYNPEKKRHATTRDADPEQVRKHHRSHRGSKEKVHGNKTRQSTSQSPVAVHKKPHRHHHHSQNKDPTSSEKSRKHRRKHASASPSRSVPKQPSPSHSPHPETRRRRHAESQSSVDEDHHRDRTFDDRKRQKKSSRDSKRIRHRRSEDDRLEEVD